MLGLISWAGIAMAAPVEPTWESESAPRADFYLSPHGSDSWSGTLAIPNVQGSDGPFATLACARDAVRELKKKKSTDILVLIREGTYPLKKTIAFGLQDSGVGDSTVTYAAYPGEKPVFSSGREIKGWKKVSGKLPGLPKEAQGKTWVANVSDRFFTLYDAEGLLPRARSTGFIPLAGGSRNRLHFPKGRLKNWPNIEDVEIIIRPHHAWISNVLPLVSVDEEKQVAHTSIAATYAMNKLHFLKTTESCWVENVLEELDEQGEWVLNTKQGKVYLWPRGKSPVMAPQLIELIRVEGEIDKQGAKDIPVRNLCFRGLTFMHGDRYTLTQDDAGLQHDWDMLDKANALVRLRGTENCTIEQCHFTHSGSGAIRVDLHGQNNEISGNHIEQMGGAGILLCGYGPGTKDVNKKNLVTNNHIHHMGRIYLHSPGIMIWQSGENRVANNLIHHMPYCGMIVSGCMTHFFTRNGRELGRTIRRHEIGDLPRTPTLEDVRPYLHTHDNLIEYNEIHNVMEIMGDGNGIYIRGAGAGNVIRRNYIHHLVTPMLMQAAIRTDGGQRDTLIAENLIYKCMAQGIILKLNNRAENNIVADVLAPPRGYYLSLREGPLTDAVITRNIFYSTGKDTVFIDELPPGNGRKTEDRRGRALARAKDADTDYNIYYSTVDPSMGKTMLAKQQADGVDTHSQAVDPLFVDPENGDFSFRPNSPALEMGIVPIDLSKVGLRMSALGVPESDQDVQKVVVAHSALQGIGVEKGVMRRDPSDIIKVGDLYYVWYSKGKISPGYDATVWYATSPDGHVWTEKGLALAKGEPNSWEGASVFTPNILVAEGRYWLFYTGVSKEYKRPYNPDSKIGIAVSGSPDGPWERLATNPALKNSDNPDDFDSHLVDDACLIVRDGKYWFYYKGRQLRKSPAETQMGLAIADHPQGPYVKHEANPVIPGSHEVLVWPQGTGVAAMIGTTGPKDITNTIQYAEDGIHFSKTHDVKNGPWAGGAYRPEAFTQTGTGDIPEWGVEIGRKHGKNGQLPFIQRFDVKGAK